ncbi:MAG: tRNA (adenosine(37)-N6)-dimethylallyltransferase MiaA [Anaerolineae bacterium]|nr:tRNA (adenosine(37)-N6)-dimethylallyltransferase MiaA [Anaerolineae bacterium]
MAGDDRALPPLIVVLGPTASGKTDAGIALAQALGGEILSADSRQVYRQMDIGSAKPTPEQRAQATHHLLDLVDPDRPLSLADWLGQARTIIADVHARGRLPLVVGGTGQYITALIEGWSIPRVPPDDALRAELAALAEALGTAALHDRLRALDPEAADSIHPNNLRRVIRALEVCHATGARWSDLQRKQPPRFRIRQYGLTLAREALYERADSRFDRMMELGFLDEVRHLLALGYDRRLPSMSGLGYAELSAHLLDGEPLDEAVLRAKHNTHDFIRRQYTWFRGHDGGKILWQDMAALAINALVDDAARWLHQT